MGIINLLDQHTINLISAGEVVERPASVIKELLENAIDAGSTLITVEIKAGGASYMRVSDNGKGMSHDDVLMCVKKHATSKIKNSEDLSGINTLGFRGEALAAISSVSRFQIISRREEDITGTLLEFNGEEKTKEEDSGCPAGTSVTVCDLFFNLPARRKFLKKPATETGVISQYVEKIALSHPEIAFKYTADGNLKFQTAGNSSLSDTIYSIYGREFASEIEEVSYQQDGISVKGYITKPEYSKTNRNFQTVFVNNRYVRAKSVMFAVEDAYKNYILSDKYPCYVLFCEVNPHTVDVNVHPAKLEIEFSDEKAVYSVVFTALRKTLQNLKNPLALQQDIPRQVTVDNPVRRQENKEITEQNKKEVLSDNCHIKNDTPKETTALPFKSFEEIFKIEEVKPDSKQLEFLHEQSEAHGFKTAEPIGVLHSSDAFEHKKGDVIINEVQNYNSSSVPQKDTPENIVCDPPIVLEETRVDYRMIGEVFNTYILVESGENLVLIDKHAAHERILYEELKKSSKNDAVQLLMVPAVVELDRKTAECISDFTEQITSLGFEIEPFGDNSFIIRSVPAIFSGISQDDIQDIVEAIAENIAEGKKTSLPVDTVYDDILHTAACKAAIKAKRKYAAEDMEFLVKRLYELGNITYCPHGRPVCRIFTKKELNKLFFRT